MSVIPVNSWLRAAAGHHGHTPVPHLLCVTTLFQAPVLSICPGSSFPRVPIPADPFPSLLEYLALLLRPAFTPSAFLSLSTVDVWGWMVLSSGGCPVLCSLPSSSLCPPDVPHTSRDNRTFSKLHQTPLGHKTTWVGNHRVWFRPQSPVSAPHPPADASPSHLCSPSQYSLQWLPTPSATKVYAYV